MKAKTLTLTLLLSVSPTAIGGEVHEYCKALADTAETAAEKRYEGVAMSRLMEIAGDNEVAKELVREAYDLPNYTAEEYQRRDVREFGNTVYAACDRGMQQREQGASGQVS